MSSERPHRGGAPVGHLGELPIIEAASVHYLRLWCNGPESQEKVWNDFSISLGPAPARQALKAFENLCTLCVEKGRRPLMRHQVGCKCLGGDESCFANLIAMAANSDREDAMLIATLIVRADFAPAAASLAEQVGLAFKQMMLKPENRISTIERTPRRLH